MTTVRLPPGGRVTVVAQDPSLVIDNTLPPWGEAPVDPGYGYPETPVDPGWSGGVAPPGEEGGAPHPEHPIVIVPSPPGTGGPGVPVDPGWSGGVAPPGQEGGAPRPTHPIVYPPEITHPIVLPPEVAPPTTPDGTPIDWKIAFIPPPGPGWVVYGVPNGPHVTPSRKKK